MTPREWAGRHTRCGARADTVGAKMTRAMPSRGFTRVEEAVLEEAHELGPPPKRPQRTSLCTPGRRALIAGRAAATGSRR